MKKAGTHRKVKYTKMVIKESLFELLESNNLQQITVKRLCELADINRGTFYAHYSDINDLVKQLETELAEKSKQMINFDDIGNTDWYYMFVDIFTHVKSNIDDYKIIFLNPDSAKCLAPLLTMVYKHHMDALVNQNQLSAITSDYIFTFLSHWL